MVQKGSDLYDALDRKDEALAKKIYNDTTERYKKLHSKEDRDWFSMIHNKQHG